MTWGHAVDVFEELDHRGLASTSAIERAYKQDSGLMWRLVACLCNINYLTGHLWERFTEVMSWCEYYRPYFKRYRVGNCTLSSINCSIFRHRHWRDNRGLRSIVLISSRAEVMTPPWTTSSSILSIPMRRILLLHSSIIS